MVVSNATYNGSRLDIVVMAVTSQPPSGARVGDTVVQKWQAAGLLKPSVVKPVFATIEQRLVIRTLGKLVTMDLEAVRQTIAQVIG
ncbi:MAG TPA: type II toxin-antitoxin system PemK/MazF family toxin [Alphaproteobacteria bacterium]|nr:type II toxin-antitoxin system PemK/MazF family toxin [Alphaproteobacteria bacterium]